MTKATELQAETSWFHLFRSMIEGGDAKEMGPTPFMVYCVIKSYTNFTTGKAFPSVQTIMDKSGLSKSSVLRALKVLDEFGYLSVEKRGRNNVYRLREKVTMNDDQGRPAAVATWDYLPTTIKAAQAELRNFLLEGKKDGLQIIQIETLHLNVQINQGEGGNTQANFSPDAMRDPRIRELAQKIDSKRRQ